MTKLFTMPNVTSLITKDCDKHAGSNYAQATTISDVIDEAVIGY